MPMTVQGIHFEHILRRGIEDVDRSRRLPRHQSVHGALCQLVPESDPPSGVSPRSFSASVTSTAISMTCSNSWPLLDKRSCGHDVECQLTLFVDADLPRCVRPAVGEGLQSRTIIAFLVTLFEESEALLPRSIAERSAKHLVGPNDPEIPVDDRHIARNSLEKEGCTAAAG